MKPQFRLIQRGCRGGKFYLVAVATGKRISLGAVTRDEAEQIVAARNQAARQPSLNLQIARAYLAGASDLAVCTRTWQQVIGIIIDSKVGASKDRWERAARDPALASLLERVVVETDAATLLAALRKGTVSTNGFLHAAHNYCVKMGWLPWPIVPPGQWPAMRFRPKRAITAEEHRQIVERERNTELRTFYEMLWFTGGAQSDIARLKADDIDWGQRTVAYLRAKTGTRCVLHFGERLEKLLRTFPREGFLFPRLWNMDPKHRAKEFRRRCLGLGIDGISLHSYRYAWAERARTVGYPERFAQEALGHSSKAVHRAYAKRALVTLPSLESYEESVIAHSSGHAQ